MMLRTVSLTITLTAAIVLAPAPATAAADPAPRAENAQVRTAVRASKARRTGQRPKVHVTPRPRGYGFLPGYEPAPPNSLPDYRRNAKNPWSEGRYYSWGRWNYGWGGPGYVRGRYTGGSIGPCWAQTPIGAVWTCGR